MSRNSLHTIRKSVLVIVAFLFITLTSTTVPIAKQKGFLALDDQLASMTLDEKIGQFFMIAAYSGKGETHLAEVENSIKQNKVGGIIWFQGNKENYLEAAKRMQLASKTPLFYGMDAEWGASMRLEGESRFPYAYSLGSADDIELTKRIAEMMAQECRELGIHFNFAPVADVNSNPRNPVIGFRSFGENPEKVGNHVGAMVKGLEKNGIASTLKHFPGHGDTDVDSHLDLPVVSRSIEEIEAIDLLPFREGILAGASSIMIAHLSVPALDPTGTPSSLSKPIIKEYLQQKMNFKGLVISDALNMKAVADRYGKSEVAVKAFEAGCDILLCPENVADAISAIKKKVESGQISMEEINARCLKILKAKEKFVIHPPTFKSYTIGEQDWARNECFEKSTVLLKNEENVLPISRMDEKMMHIVVGEKSSEFKKMLNEFGKFQEAYISFDDLEKNKLPKNLDQFSTIVLTIHATSVRPANNFGTSEKLQVLFDAMPLKSKVSCVVFGNPLVFSANFNTSHLDAIIVGFENNAFVQNRLAQQLVGSIPFQGKMPFSIGTIYKRGFGLATEWNGRLKFSQPEELGIKPSAFDEIDRIIENGITNHAMPGCQVLAAVGGKIIFRKSYGTHRYNDEKVKDDDLYDIASISKIAGSTVSIMKLQSEGKFSLDNQLKDYIPEVTGDTPYSNLVLRDMLAHRAGLTPWIPFYKRTLVNGELNPELYSSTSKEGFTTKVADKLYIKSDYQKAIYDEILSYSLGAKNYEYSDVGYYFVKKIIEKQSHESLDNYILKELYEPMGLKSIIFNPYLTFDLKDIVPTEDDKIFRKRLIHGYVHDQGAAMLGGIAGHAGVFSNATDLAGLFQMFLNNGKYGGVQYIKPEVIKEYTKVQFSGNRRGAGFDKPKLNGGGGTCHTVASPESYGHSGFTGTVAWADPKNQINYVFLSNRVYPDAQNWKIVKMNIRTDIQKVIYDAVASAKK